MQNNYAIAIGNFDGFHLGHVKIINKLNEVSKNNNIITFALHPLSVMQGKQNHEITPTKHKLEVLKEHGFKNPLVYDFTKILKLKAKDFIVNKLVAKENIKHLVFGQDFKMGSDQKNAQEIKTIAGKHNIACHIVTRDERYSSSIIRELLKQGNVKEANTLLGRNFCIKGTVVKGRGLGAQIGFATANINPFNYVLPKLGVYQVYITNHSTNTKHKAICNIGVRPTVENTNKVLLEVHIFDFLDDICNNKVSVEFIDFIRAEQKFNSVDDLIKQIHVDCEKVKHIFKTQGV